VPQSVDMDGCLANLQLCNILLDTNASLTGWGASLGAMSSSPTHTSAGWWPLSEQCHINVLEITTVHNALKSFLPLLQGKAVQVHCDNIVGSQKLRARQWIACSSLGHSPYCPSPMNPQLS